MIGFLLAQAEAPAADLSWPAALVAIVTLLATTGVLGALVKLLNAKAKQLEAERDAMIEGVESIEDGASKLLAKRKIKAAATEHGVEPTLSEAVKRKTGRVE